HHMHSRLALVDVATNAVTWLPFEGMIRRAEPSPDGRSLLLETMERPFSYIVRCDRFPVRVERCDLATHARAELARLPLAEEVPIAFDAVRAGPRAFQWRSDRPGTLRFVQALDGGDPEAKVEMRDAIFELEGVEPRKVFEVATRVH